MNRRDRFYRARRTRGWYGRSLRLTPIRRSGWRADAGGARYTRELGQRQATNRRRQGRGSRRRSAEFHSAGVAAASTNNHRGVITATPNDRWLGLTRWTATTAPSQWASENVRLAHIRRTFAAPSTLVFLLLDAQSASPRLAYTQGPAFLSPRPFRPSPHQSLRRGCDAN